MGRTARVTWLILCVTALIAVPCTAKCSGGAIDLNSLPNSAFTASSHIPGREPWKVKDAIGWCPDPKQKEPHWIDVTLPDPKGMTTLSVTHPDLTNFVNTFLVRYQPSGQSGLQEIVTVDGPLKDWNATLIDNAGAINSFQQSLAPPLAIKRLRIIPQTWTGNACMKMSFTGCVAKDLCTQPCQNNGVCAETDYCWCPKGFAGQYCELNDAAVLKLFWNLAVTKITTTVVETNKIQFQKFGTLNDFTLVPGVNGKNTAINLPIGGSLVSGAIPCLTQPINCVNGITISLWFQLPVLNNQGIISAGGEMISATVQGSELVVSVKMSRVYEVRFPITALKWHKMTVSWSPRTSLRVWVDKLQQERFGRRSTSGPQTIDRILIGQKLQTPTGQLKIDKLTLAPVDITILKKMSVPFQPAAPNTTLAVPTRPPTTPLPPTKPTTGAPTKPPTKAPSPAPKTSASSKATPVATTPPTTTTAAPTTATPITPLLQLNFTKLANKPVVTAVTHNVSVINKPKVTPPPNGTITLQGNKTQCIAVEAAMSSCLVNVDACTAGFTLQIDMMWNTLVENTLLFGNGGIDKKRPGFNFMYRYGKFRASISSSTRTWYVTLDKTSLPERKWHRLTFTWNSKTGLGVAVNLALKQSNNSYPLCLTPTCVGSAPVFNGAKCGLPQQLCVGAACSGFTQTPTVVSVNKMTFWNKPLTTLTQQKVIVSKFVTVTNTPPVSTCTTSSSVTPTPKPVPTAKPTPATAAPSTTQGCFDVRPDCHRTAVYSCSDPAQSAWVEANCRKFCGLCGSSAAVNITSTTPTPGRTGFPQIFIPTIRYRTLTSGSSQFLCTVIPSNEQNVGYEVSWIIGGKHVAQQNVSTTTIVDVALDNKHFSQAGSSKQVYCQVRGFYIETGRRGPWHPSKSIESKIIFRTGITKFTLVEGQRQVIIIDTNGPKELHCVGAKTSSCITRVQIKMQGGLTLTCPDKTKLPDLVFRTESGSTGGTCSSIVSSGKQTIFVTVTAVVDFIREPTEKRNFEILITQSVGTTTITQNIRKYEVTILDKTSTTVCKSINDPHLATFDRCRYDNFLEGEFVLFKNQKPTNPHHEFRVHAFYRKCSRRATCNCAVAVQSGDDVILIDRCQKIYKPKPPGGSKSKSSKKSRKKSSKKKSKKSSKRHGRDTEWAEEQKERAELRMMRSLRNRLQLADAVAADDPHSYCRNPNALGNFIGKGKKPHHHNHQQCGARVPQAVLMYLNGELTPGTRVVSSNSGKEFKIFLPTGAYVQVVLSGNEFINIMVYPSPVDYQNTEGLCGTWDGNAKNDFRNPDGTDSYKRCGHRQPNIFNLKWRVKSEDSIYRGVVANNKLQLSVAQQQHCSCEGSQAQCNPNLAVSNCRLTRISRAIDVTSALVKQAKPSYTQILHTVKVAGRRRRQAVGPSPSANLTEGAELEEVGGFTFEPGYRGPEASWGSSNWTEATARAECEKHLLHSSLGKQCSSKKLRLAENMEDDVEACIEDIKIAGSTEWLDSARDAVRLTCRDQIANEPEVWPMEGTDAPSEIIDALCPGDCSGHGKCQNGSCICETNWASEDCSIDSTKPPEVVSVQNSLCDTSEELCEVAVLQGFGFTQQQGIKCKLLPLQWDESTGKFNEPGDQLAVTSTYTFLSTEEVQCALPEKRPYSVSVERAAAYSSDSAPIIVLNRDCFSCVRSNGTCVRKDRCLIGSECFWPGDVNPNDNCQTCNISVSISEWTEVTGCRSGPERVRPSKPDGLSTVDKALIGLGAGVALLLLAVTATLMYKRAHSRSKTSQMKPSAQYEITQTANPRGQQEAAAHSSF